MRLSASRREQTPELAINLLSLIMPLPEIGSLLCDVRFRLGRSDENLLKDFLNGLSGDLSDVLSDDLS